MVSNFWLGDCHQRTFGHSCTLELLGVGAMLSSELSVVPLVTVSSLLRCFRLVYLCQEFAQTNHGTVAEREQTLIRWQFGKRSVPLSRKEKCKLVCKHHCFQLASFQLVMSGTQKLDESFCL